MRTTLTLDDDLLAKAEAYTGLREKSALIREALRAFDLRDLPQATIASNEEVLRFIDRQALFGRGIGYVDAHLLAAARLTPGARLWTHDRRLYAAAAQLGLAAILSH